MKTYISFNPYFIGLPILINEALAEVNKESIGFNPYFIGLPILICIQFNQFKNQI